MSNHARSSEAPIYDETVQAQAFDPANPDAIIAAPLALPEAPPAAKAAPKPRTPRQPRKPANG